LNAENPHQNKLKHIAVTNDVYEQLRSQGKLGDTFNDVVKRLLGKETTTPHNSNLKDKGGIQ
jgi:predicted CopG family antitoxin